MRQSLSEFVVSAEALSKSFGRTHALAGFDLAVRPGEVHGFLGPNGAGKSTTIRALLGQLRLDAGRITVFGLDARRDAVDIHARLAYVPGDTALWPGLSGGECIDLLGGLHGGLDRARREELIDRFELDPTRRFRTYSKGNRQKVALVAALAVDAELLVLDEPTSGLDPLMEEVFQQVVAERAAEGTSVLLSSHILSEVEALCRRVTVIRSGRAVFSGELTELRAGAPIGVEALTQCSPSGLEGLDGVSSLTLTGIQSGIRTRLLSSRTALPAVIAALSEAGPRDLAVRPPSLQQLFLHRYEEGASAPSGDPSRVKGGE